jgi:hypothetical protein
MIGSEAELFGAAKVSTEAATDSDYLVRWNGELPFREEMPRTSRAADIPLQYTRQSEQRIVKYLRNEEEIAAASNCSSDFWRSWHG